MDTVFLFYVAAQEQVAGRASYASLFTPVVHVPAPIQEEIPVYNCTRCATILPRGTIFETKCDACVVQSLRVHAKPKYQIRIPYHTAFGRLPPTYYRLYLDMLPFWMTVSLRLDPTHNE
ncbi:hypothetical protein A2U01_0012575 [Trifolium medium]|uniref:Uncharacterized protein n=1 Tax=Trifolium medium TaxID=97028 RepID=A0A392MVT1_9FABA|nr:hypothetical protein [Trifolium medium]